MPFNLALCENQMKLPLSIAAALFSVRAFALDITMPEPTDVSEFEAWKFGIKAAEKEIGSKLYVSIEIEERMLCPIKKIEAYINKHDEYWEELEVASAEMTYGVSVNSTFSKKLKFVIHCSKNSNIHRNRWFSYEFKL